MENDRCPSPVRSRDDSSNLLRSSREQQSMQEQYYATLLQQDRESEGRCGLCGVQTHRLCFRENAGHMILCKEPLDVEHEVRRGRCLLCHPLPQQQQVQQMDGDSATVYSGATASVGSAASGCASYPSMVGVNPSPSHVFDFPAFMMQQQHHRYVEFAPLPLPTNATAATPMAHQLPRPTLTTIQSLPTADITTILALMRIHPTSHALISTALHTLDNILSHQPENSPALARVGAIPTLLNTLVVFPTCPTVHQFGTSILHALSTHPSNRPILVQSGTIPTLVHVMNTFPVQGDIQRSSILALGNIAKHHIDYKILICEGGGMMAIMKAVENFGRRSDDDEESEGVLRAAYWSLRRLGMPRLRGLAREEMDESDGEA
eukprot:CCRYP_009182-RA/>CCRYP_009182-RA protein AED:0.30 eAED:0.30 QI:0/-1/0/1/-1/1/1/0/376